MYVPQSYTLRCDCKLRVCLTYLCGVDGVNDSFLCHYLILSDATRCFFVTTNKNSHFTLLEIIVFKLYLFLKFNCSSLCFSFSIC